MGVGGLISAASDGWYKVVLGTYKYSGWTGPTYPNMTFKGNMGQITETCKNSVNKGCLYNIIDDPNEHVNLAQQKPAIFNKMIARVAEIQKTAFSPDRVHTARMPATLPCTGTVAFGGHS